MDQTGAIRSDNSFSTLPLDPNSLSWAFPQQLIHDNSDFGPPTSVSSSSSSPPYNLSSSLSTLESNGVLNQASSPMFNSRFGAMAPPTQRRQLTLSRSSNPLGSAHTVSSENNLHRSRSIDASHPYALHTSPTSRDFHAAMRRKRRYTSNLAVMAEDQRLESLWTAHGVGGSAHLGLQPITPVELSHGAAGGSDDWSAMIADMNVGGDPLLDGSLFYDSEQSSMDPSMYGSLESMQFPMDSSPEHHLFPEMDVRMTLEPESELNLGAQDTHIDEVEHYDDVEHDTNRLFPESVVRRSTSADSNVTANGATHSKTIDDDDDDEVLIGENDGHDAEKGAPTKPTNNFVNKLHLMISDEKSAEFIRWTELGTSFIVSSAGEFSRSILGQHFKHSNFSSFVRQLNMYGFHKINRTPRNQRVQSDAQQWEFSHPKFLRGRADLLDDIRRKPVEPDPAGTRQRVELPSEVAAKLRQMSADHAEVVNALKIEQRKVDQLTKMVKILYDHLGAVTSRPLPGFPTELLQSRPSLREVPYGNGMDLAGNGLIPTSSTPIRGRNSAQRLINPSVPAPVPTKPGRRRATKQAGSTDPDNQDIKPMVSASTSNMSTMQPVRNDSNITSGLNLGSNPSAPATRTTVLHTTNDLIRHENNIFVR